MDTHSDAQGCRQYQSPARASRLASVHCQTWPLSNKICGRLGSYSGTPSTPSPTDSQASCDYIAASSTWEGARELDREQALLLDMAAMKLKKGRRSEQAWHGSLLVTSLGQQARQARAGRSNVGQGNKLDRAECLTKDTRASSTRQACRQRSRPPVLQVTAP